MTNRMREFLFLPIILAYLLLACSMAAGEEKQEAPQAATVHMRLHANEPFLDRAIEADPSRVAFNSIWATRKYYPSWPEDTNNGNPAEQAREVRAMMDKAIEHGFEAHPGFGLHPIKWLDADSWQMRADALEEFILEGGFEGTELSLDIEGYGYTTVDENGKKKRTRVPPPYDEEAWVDLVEACAPVRHVFLKYRIKPIIYPAGGPRFEPYTRAALALGAWKMGDEYCFVLAKKLRAGETLTRDQWQFWLNILRNTDPDDRGVPYIPGLYTSNLQQAVDRFSLSVLGIDEVWLFVDDKDYLKPE